MGQLQNKPQLKFHGPNESAGRQVVRERYLSPAHGTGPKSCPVASSVDTLFGAHKSAPQSCVYENIIPLYEYKYIYTYIYYTPRGEFLSSYIHISLTSRLVNPHLTAPRAYICITVILARQFAEICQNYI